MAEIVTVQSNFTWTTDDTQENDGGMMLYVDDNNYAFVGSRSTGGVGSYRVQIYQGGSSVYSLQTAITKGKDVKIEYGIDNSIKFYYWNSTVWTQMGTTQTQALGSPVYLLYSFQDATVWAGVNPANFDDAFMVNGVYSTQDPTSSVMSDTFTGTTIDTAKWTETDPNGRISQNGTLIYANPHSSNIARFVDKLQSVDTLTPTQSGFLAIL